jgi:hypothetical protein
VYDQFYGDCVVMGVMGAAAFQLVDDPSETSRYGRTSRLPKWPERSSRRTRTGTSCSVQASKASRKSGSPLKTGGQHRVSREAS